MLRAAVRQTRRTALLSRLCLLALVVAGCSRSPTRRVSGEVSYEGVPIQGGTIELIPIEGTGGPTVGGNITEGAYDVPAEKGPLADGTYRVKMWAVRDTGKYPPGPRYAKSVTIREPIIPAEYNVDSKLQMKVNASAENRFDFHLKKSGSGSGK